jgi:hypothetical protein
LIFEDAIPGPVSYLVLTPSKILSPLGFSVNEPSDLRSPDNGADYLVITHADFAPQAQQLADFRQGRPGTERTRVVDVQDIYDEFNDGELDAEAIRAFLQHAFDTWQSPPPSYVVLLGDGHYDFRNYTGVAPITRIPPYLLHLSGSVQGEAPADNRYVCVSGDDGLPDMHIGRLPVDTVDEAQTVVDKILAYETSPPSGDWVDSVLFTADNPDPAGDFSGLSDEIAGSYLPASYDTTKVYLGDTCPYENPAATCRQSMIDALNQGSLISNYVGHGHTTMWSGERLLRTEDIASMANGSKLPVQLTFACLTGHFGNQDQGQDSIDERLVTAAGKGAIASWGNADLSYSLLDQWVHEGFYQAMFEHGIRQVGAATTSAKIYYCARTSNPLLLERKHLFGDPALSIAGSSEPHGLILNYFETMPQHNAVRLEWQTVSEVDIVGFNLHRAPAIDGQRSQLNGSLILTSMPGNSMGDTYEFMDDSVMQGTTYYYWLEIVLISGQSSWTEPVEAKTLYLVFVPSVNR